MASVMVADVYAVFIEVRSRPCSRSRMFDRLAGNLPRMFHGCWV